MAAGAILTAGAVVVPLSTQAAAAPLTHTTAARHAGDFGRHCHDHWRGDDRRYWRDDDCRTHNRASYWNRFRHNDWRHHHNHDCDRYWRY
ncbi:hypothetical protein [Streptomyces sp. NPDC004065]|uniref:hypothetical protein n=1 Tax=Streptomyces sp. NPDC004065 TaxID=3364689 RepID=UPI00384C24F1